MKKIIRRVGDSIGIIFNKEEAKIYRLKVGNVVSFTIIHDIRKIKEAL